MINYLYEIYKVNAATKCQQRASLFNRFAFYTEVVFKCGTALYVVSISSYFLYPIYTYLFKGEVIVVLSIYFPGIDETTREGYIFLLCYHIAVLVLALIAVSACDFLFTMLIVNTPAMAVLIEMEVQQLNDILTSEKVDVPLMKSKLRNILLMHREMTEWVNWILRRKKNYLNSYRYDHFVAYQQIRKDDGCHIFRNLFRANCRRSCIILYCYFRYFGSELHSLYIAEDRCYFHNFVSSSMHFISRCI